MELPNGGQEESMSLISRVSSSQCRRDEMCRVSSLMGDGWSHRCQANAHPEGKDASCPRTREAQHHCQSSLGLLGISERLSSSGSKLHLGSFGSLTQWH